MSTSGGAEPVITADDKFVVFTVAPVKAEVDKAIQIKSDYMEAIAYKNLLLRLQANLEKDQAKQSALLKEADKLRDQAMALQKKQAAGIK